MNDAKKLRALIVYGQLIDEILHIVYEEHPEILAKAAIQVVDKNPELFKDALEKVKNNAIVQEEDNPKNGISRV